MALHKPWTWFSSTPQPTAQPTAQVIPRPSRSPWDKEGVPGPSKGILGWLRKTIGGYTGPESSQGTEQEYSIIGEKAAAGPRDVIFPWFLPYHDDYTQETNVMRLAYRRMFADPYVKTALAGKIFGVGSLDLHVLPANKKNPRDRIVAEHVDWILNQRLHGGIPGLVWSILSGGLIDGYSVCEKVWKIEEKGRYAGKYSLIGLKPKDVGQDMVLQTDEFRNVVGILGLRYNAGIEFSPANFVIWRHLPLFDTPTGQSDLRAAYSSWWMLDTIRKLRAIHCERNAIPMLVGTWQNNTVKTALEQSLAKAKSQRWMAIPESTKVEALNIAGSADAVFDKFCTDLVHEIFLSIQGAILQTLEGSTVAGRGNSQIHKSTSDLFVWYLANSIQSLLNDPDNGVVKDIVDLNWAVDEYPRADLSAVDTNELLLELQMDMALHNMGVPLSLESMYDRYDRLAPANPEDSLGMPDQSAAPGIQSGGGPGQGRTQNSIGRMLKVPGSSLSESPLEVATVQPFRRNLFRRRRR